VERIAAVYREYRRTGVPVEVPGFCKVASLDEVRNHKYALTPGRYVGAEEAEEDDETFEEKIQRLVGQLSKEMDESDRLDEEIKANLKEIGLWTVPAE
jgi:type I restriction enzyme M protein